MNEVRPNVQTKDLERSADRSPFWALYDAEFERMTRVAYLTTLSAAAAEDIAQDAFEELFRRWNDVRNPAAYLHRAVVSRSTSWVRRRVIERRYERSASPQPALVDDLETTNVLGAVAALAPRQRAAVILRYYADFTEAEIASSLGCRVGTVKSTLARARSHLKEVLDGDG